MAIKVLGQSNPAATTLTTLYTAPAGNGVVVSTLNMCNQGAAGSFRVAIRPAAATIAAAHYLFFDATIAANQTIPLTAGLTLAATDVISVYASHANMSFHAYGTET